MKFKSLSILNLTIVTLVSCGIDSMIPSATSMNSSSASQTPSFNSGPLTSLDRINLDLASVSYTLGSVLPKIGPNL